MQSKYIRIWKILTTWYFLLEEVDLVVAVVFLLISLEGNANLLVLNQL